MEIKKVIKNKIRASQQRDNRLTVYPTEEILGSVKSVKDFAAFGLNHAEDLAVIHASFLLDYCERVDFTPEQLAHFRMGLDCWEKFFKATESDTKSYLMAAEQQNQRNKKGVRDSVG